MPEETSAKDTQCAYVQTSGNCVTKLSMDPFEDAVPCTLDFAAMVQRRIRQGPVAMLWSVRADGVLELYRR